MTTVLDQLCKKTLDLTGRNSLISFTHGVTRKNYIRVIDERYDFLFNELLSKKFQFKALPGLEEALPDENTAIFNEAADEALAENQDYKKLAEKSENTEDEEVEFDLNTLERKIKDQLRVELGLKPRPKSSNDVSDLKNLAIIYDFDPSYELQASVDGDAAHQDKFIQTIFPEVDLNKRLNTIYHAYMRELTDRSINPLYVVFGFLSWKDLNSKKRYNSPLLLMPVVMHRKATSLGYQYSVTMDNEPVVNEALKEKLLTQYGIKMPEIGDYYSKEFKLSKFFSNVRKKIQNKTDWKLKNNITFTTLKHSCISIYEDLKPENWEDQEITSHENLGKLLKGRQANETGAVSLREYEDIDHKIINNNCPHMYLSCDSSQYNAIIKVLEGDPLIIKGPPGTGKSQTISNAIAALASEGKKVLFIAEKAAAINQISKNLNKIKFGDLIFEAHADIKKDQMYESLDERLKLKHLFNENYYEQTKLKLVDRITYLRNYKEFLFSDSGFPELTPKINKKSESLNYYELIGRYLSLFDKCKSLEVPKIPILKSPLECSYGNFSKLVELISSLLKFGRLENQEILKISNLDADQISISVFKEETEKLRELVDDTLEFYKSASCSGSLIAGMHLIEQGAVVDQEVGELKDQLSHKVGLMVAVKLKEELNTYRKIYLSRITNEDLKEVEAVLLGLGADPMSLKELSSRKERALSLRSNIDYAIGLKGAISSSIVAGEISDGDILHILSRIQKLELCKLFAYNKELELEDDFDILDFEDFKVSLARIDDLIMSFTGSKSQKNLKDTKSKIEKMDSGVSSPSSRIPRQNIIRECKEIYSSRHIFSFFSKRYRDAIELLRSFGFNPGNKEGTKAHIDELIECLEIYDELNDNSISQFFSDENKIYRLCKRDIAKISSEIIVPMNHVVGDIKNSDIKIKIFEFIIKNKSQEIAQIKVVDDDEVELEKLLKINQKEIESIDLIEKFYGKTDIKKKDAKLNIWSVDHVIEVFDRIVRDTIPKDVFLDGELTQIVVIKDQLIKHIGSNKKYLSLYELFSYTSDIESVDVDELSNTVQQLGKRIVDNSKFFEMLGLGDDEQGKYFNSKIHGDISSNISKLELLGDYCTTYYPAGNDSSRDEHELFGIIQFFSEQNNSDISKLINQKQIEESIKKSIFEELLNSKYFSLSKGKDLLVNFCHLQLMSIYLYKNKYIKKHKVLENYTRGAFEDNISELSKVTSLLQELERDKCLSAAAEIKIEEGIGHGPKKDFTDKSLIRNEITKKRAKLSHRPLIKRASKALTAMKPIWLMTPQTVSDYLPRKREMFDVLIIDEASQMLTEHAIPSVIRAKQMIVVGDNQQMPPTNLFVSSSGSEEDEIETESILDACESTLGKTVQLNYHYRSRHQNLIQFSNFHFYKNELNIVNSAKIESDDLGVKLVYVEDGVYQSDASSGRNEIEADKVIEVIDQCIKAFPRRSIGVVTINRAQQDLLEQKWDYHCNDSKAAKSFVEYWEREENKSETMIFRNLERIQGDERDIIIISTVYGKNDRGKVMQRFGPILFKSGHRRLNVLFTRAKSMLYLVTSLQSSDIRNPAGSRGKEIFHKYLHYSSDPNNHLYTGEAKGDPDSDFEVFVANKIREYGYEVDYQIGVNGFKIDLGIRDPKDGSVYIAGIECDGATFHSSPQARDRDILRQQLLEDYGWRIFRIWSTDWFRDSDGEIEKLIKWLKCIRDPMPASPPTVKALGKNEIKLFKEGDSITEIWNANKYVCTISKSEKRASYADSLLMSRGEANKFHVDSKLLLYYKIEGVDECKGEEYSSFDEALNKVKNHIES